MTELDLLQKKFRQDMNEMADALSTGAAKDYAQYMKMVGVIEGLAIAERHLLDLMEKVQDAE